MFASQSEIKSLLHKSFPAELADKLEQLCTAGIALVAGEAGANIPVGGSHLGGTPDLPANTSWPVRPASTEADEIANRGGLNHGPRLRRHLAMDLPFQFALQVNLAAVDALNIASDPMPASGRLLFFFDEVVLPWDGGPQRCRVIWDRTPADEIRRAVEPEIFADLSKEYVEQYVAEWNAKASKYNLPPADESSIRPPYRGVLRPLVARIGWQLPSFHQLPESIREQLESHAQGLDEIYMDRFVEGEKLTNTHMLGLASPEQDDPAYEAALVQLFNKPFLAPEEYRNKWPLIEEEARNWRLLLQLDMSDYAGKNSAGKVYFLIRKDDLDAWDFSRVSAVYQQT